MAGETVNGLKVYMALAEDLSLDPSTHASQLTTACNYSSRGIQCFCGHLHSCAHNQLHRYNFKKFFLNKNSENIDEQQITCLAYARPLVVLTSSTVGAIRT